MTVGWSSRWSIQQTAACWCGKSFRCIQGMTNIASSRMCLQVQAIICRSLGRSLHKIEVKTSSGISHSPFSWSFLGRILVLIILCALTEGRDLKIACMSNLDRFSPSLESVCDLQPNTWQFPSLHISLKISGSIVLPWGGARDFSLVSQSQLQIKDTVGIISITTCQLQITTANKRSSWKRYSFTSLCFKMWCPQ